MTELHSDFTADYQDWTFMSVFHWGELSGGEWTVQVVDRRVRNTGVLQSVRIELFGTSELEGGCGCCSREVWRTTVFSSLLAVPEERGWRFRLRWI